MYLVLFKPLFSIHICKFGIHLIKLTLTLFYWRFPIGVYLEPSGKNWSVVSCWSHWSPTILLVDVCIIGMCLHIIGILNVCLRIIRIYVYKCIYVYIRISVWVLYYVYILGHSDSYSRQSLHFDGMSGREVSGGLWRRMVKVAEGRTK